MIRQDFNFFGGFSAETQAKVDAEQIAQFNSKFTQYLGRDDLTIQDVITAKNYALENNLQNSNYKSNLGKFRAKDTNDYIDVFFDYTLKLEQIKNNRRYVVFKRSDDELLSKEIEYINDGKNPARFSCEVEFNPISGRVNKVSEARTNLFVFIILK